MKSIKGNFLKTGGIIIVTLIGFINYMPAAIYAQSTTPSSIIPTSSSSGNLANRIANIKTRAESEIDKRLASLNMALTKINAATKLPAADKTNFTSQIQTDIASLTTLRAKIDSDTDIVTLKSDANSIYVNFRVYAVFLPQVHELTSVDIMGVTADNLTVVAGKLQSRLQIAQSRGKDVTSLMNLLNDMNAKITDSKTQYAAVESEISPLTPSNYPGSNATLQDGRSKIQTGASDLRISWQDAKQNVAGLRALAGNSSVNSSTPSASQPSGH